MTDEGTHVVTCFLRNRGEILLLKRSDEVGSFRGLWGAVAGHAEGDPDAAAREEIAEETGIDEAVSLIRRGDPFSVEGEGRTWTVHPYLFECASRNVETDWETADYGWVPSTEILRRETVPGFWEAYDRVAPTVETVAADTDHGSAAISVRALEVLRDRAGLLACRADPATEAWEELVDLAGALLDARPSMAALANRVNRAMADASDAATPEAVERAAIEGIERAFAADEGAAARAADLAAGRSVLTLSRSGTVLDALRRAGPSPAVTVAESRPALEGVGVAAELADAGVETTLTTDAAVAHQLASEDAGVELALVGADAVLPDGRVVNKVGTRAAALAAAREGIPFYAACATDKISAEATAHLEEGDPGDLYDGPAALDVSNPIFDVTPPELVAGLVTETAILGTDEIRAAAAELRTLADWRRDRGK